ncbi:hypothetical protein [Gimesia sp.]|uniref:hypothetical protein n=1 Tax=Gimesia sp. TaxID=2024833 RepID=UPI000E9E14D6|nr:hypothetical protein [Gimesia sp.]HAH46050.1 hypothetical protein [Planctomycetaceae bacterium]HBL47223.1 hypothetical protein [Planctomycetaceae bacterium]|tara:strand:+ start:2599 stop:2976 length:378 start_codon:yes stop_codon:yes gene_type:complete
MIDFEQEQMLENPEWCLVLRHYSQTQVQVKEQDPESDGWIIRQNEVEGVVAEHLPRIHGKLIAFDLLKFQIAGRDSGVFYKVTNSGNKMLPRLEKKLRKLLASADAAEQLDDQDDEIEQDYAKSA